VSLVLLIGCREPPPPNVVIVVVADALRADRLGAYGNRQGLTPFLDSFAARAYVFRRAYSQAPWTGASVASLFTSRFPSQLGITSFRSLLGPEEHTLAEALHEHGYSTGAFIAHWFLRGTGLEQGFDVFSQYSAWSQRKTRAPALNKGVLAWLDRSRREGQPLFLYLHYLETHAPYLPPPAALQRVLDGREAPKLDTMNRDLMTPKKFQRFSAAEMRQAMDAYDAEVASLDDSLGELFSELTARGLLAHAVVVFTADHGEAFQEHGYYGHGASLFNELLHVPLIIGVPGLATRVDVDESVALIDVAPTVLELAGAPACRSFEGRTLTGTMRRAGPSWLGPLRVLWDREDGTDRPILSERAADFERSVLPEHERALILGTTKYIAAPGYEGQFYDLETNPDERDGGSVSAEDRERLRRGFDDLTRDIGQRAVASKSLPLDPQTRERLRALGYLDE
jgi:arylsulfatase A-like enzyme